MKKVKYLWGFKDKKTKGIVHDYVYTTRQKARDARFRSLETVVKLVIDKNAKP